MNQRLSAALCFGVFTTLLASCALLISIYNIRQLGENRVVRARSFIVVAPDGREAVGIDIDSNGIGRVRTYNPQRHEVCRVGSSAEGYGKFAVLGPYKEPMAEVGVMPGRYPAGALIVRRFDGTVLGYVGPSGDGRSGGLGIFNLAGNEAMVMSTSEKGDGILTVHDTNGRAACRLVAQPEGGGGIMTFSVDGHVLFSVDATTEQAGSACVHDKLGNHAMCMLADNGIGGTLWNAREHGDATADVSDSSTTGL